MSSTTELLKVVEQPRVETKTVANAKLRFLNKYFSCTESFYEW